MTQLAKKRFRKQYSSRKKDCATNEMIKFSNETNIEYLQFLFNKILGTRYHPNSLNDGFVRSIHRSVSKEDPNNYRGITLSNCLRKLFNTIWYNRLKEKLQIKNVISQGLAGLRKNL